jgi:DNA-binding NarL/FixJ family response regulator
MTIQVLIADDHPLVRDGLKAALAALPNVQVVADANQRQLPQPDRGSLHCAAVLHPRRHRSPSHAEQASMIRRYIIWPNRNAHDQRLQQIVNRANVA